MTHSTKSEPKEQTAKSIRQSIEPVNNEDVLLKKLQNHYQVMWPNPDISLDVETISSEQGTVSYRGIVNINRQTFWGICCERREQAFESAVEFALDFCKMMISSAKMSGLFEDNISAEKVIDDTIPKTDNSIHLNLIHDYCAKHKNLILWKPEIESRHEGFLFTLEIDGNKFQSPRCSRKTVAKERAAEVIVVLSNS